MINIPTDIFAQYSLILAKKSVPVSYQSHYKKWLRYYLDFCHKYGFSHSNKESLTQFIKKLQEKHQTQTQQKQAAHAVSLYYEILQVGVNAANGSNITSAPKTNLRSETIKKSPPSFIVQVHKESQSEEKDSVIAQWKNTYADMSAEIKMKHYSPKTLKVYTIWVTVIQTLDIRHKTIDSIYAGN
ncbi:MAG: hypothetical protein AB1414_15205 [bacterium]